MAIPVFARIPETQENMEDEEMAALAAEVGKEKGLPEEGNRGFRSPLNWFKMISRETHWSFVFGVMVVYGVSQGLGGGLGQVATDYYWKDTQMVQPSEAQIYQGITGIPWLVKPLWGLLTDVLPVAGYRRRPYFIFAGLLGVVSMLILSLHKKLPVLYALLAITGESAGLAIADVTIDACIAQNSMDHPSLAADMQSLNALCSSVGGLLGFSISGILVHAIGSQGVFGLLVIPFALVFTVGVVLKEPHTQIYRYREVCHKFMQASQTMWTTLKCPAVWRPCMYMYVSLALSLNVHSGMFYWYTDPTAGPSFSQESIGFIFSVASIGSLLGVLLYQNVFKDYPFRGLLFWSQLLSSFAGMLDLILVLRLNLKFGIPDYFFVVIDAGVSQLIGRIMWMPLLVLSNKLCPFGIEGTFFALIMSINNIGMMTSLWGGGLLLHMLNVTRTEFSNLWAVILIRNILRVAPLALLFLIPKGGSQSTILPADMLTGNKDEEAPKDMDDVELVSLVDNTK